MYMSYAELKAAPPSKRKAAAWAEIAEEAAADLERSIRTDPNMPRDVLEDLQRHAAVTAAEAERQRGLAEYAAWIVNT